MHEAMLVLTGVRNPTLTPHALNQLPPDKHQMFHQHAPRRPSQTTHVPLRCTHRLPQVANLLGEEIPQIYALTGRGPRSALAVLRPGLAVTELAVSPLPGQPTAVFTVGPGCWLCPFVCVTLVLGCSTVSSSAAPSDGDEACQILQR